MNKEEIKRKKAWLAVVPSGMQKRTRNSSSGFFLSTWAWQSNQCECIFNCDFWLGMEKKDGKKLGCGTTQLASKR